MIMRLVAISGNGDGYKSSPIKVHLMNRHLNDWKWYGLCLQGYSGYSIYLTQMYLLFSSVDKNLGSGHCSVWQTLKSSVLGPPFSVFNWRTTGKTKYEYLE